ncbi:hypothetical protein [Desulfuribacillus alkaliarsenatis]|uniref:DUF2568 domain-containing protein n=1 Tax=Desulfuribacillus alkaliarsenatis TaxID=766136 RepID=A0A1E5FZN7_9FIRM|nr:hypothetical protein [Desulfuribacillus alkaliarsenatis]OEF96055.1 hypothetical protein BHF68_09960 [Desulfuribacillus alkaliarsenatis]
MTKDLFLRFEHGVIGLLSFLSFAFHFDYWLWFVFWFIFPFAVGFGVFLIEKEKPHPPWKYLVQKLMFTYITPIFIFIIVHMISGTTWSLLAGWVTAIAVYRLINVHYMNDYE